MAEYRALRQRYSLLRDLSRSRTSPSPSRCSRSTRSRSTPPSCSPICCCRSRRWASTSTSSRAKGPSIERPDPHRRRRRPPAPIRAARGARACARDDSTAAPRARRAGAADRLRRRAVHAGGVRDRGRAVDDLRAHQGVHVRAARRVASALRALRRADGRLPARRRSRPARRRCRSSTRGRARSGAPTTASSPLPHTRASSTTCAASGVPVIHFGVGTTAILPDLAAAGGDVDRRRLAPAARRGVEDRSATIAASRATSIRRGCSVRIDRLLARRRRRAARAPAVGPATSSTSVTGSFRIRRSSTSRRWRGTFTPSRCLVLLTVDDH